MITPNDVLLTMQAADPATTQAQADSYYRTIQEAFSNRRDALTDRYRTRYREVTGRIPPSLDYERLLNRATIDAESQIREEYLAELTEEATQQDLADEDRETEMRQELILGSPTAWAEVPHEFPVDRSMTELARHLFPTQPAQFTYLATRLLQSMEHRGTILPDDPADPDCLPIAEQVQVQVDRTNELRRSQGRL